MSSFLAVFVIVTFVLGTVWGQAGRKPEIVKQILTDVKRIGQNGELKCTVSNKGPSHILYWHKVRPGRNDLIISKESTIIAPNDPIESGTAGDQTLRKYSIDTDDVENDQITYTLIVRRLQEEDGGDYKCLIITKSDSSKDRPQKIGRIEVQVPPQILTSRSTNNANAAAGQPFTFKCYATGVPKPNIKWVRDDGMLLPNKEQESIGEIYRINKVTPNDRGVYRCVASNQVKPPAIHKMRLTVRHKPVVKAVQDTVGQAENRQYRVNLECTVSGAPQPEVSWARVVKNSNGRIEIVKRGNKYKVKQSSWGAKKGSDDVKLSTLTIYNVRSNDYTKYFCRARNSMGKSEATITLFETTECQGSQCILSGYLGSGSSSTASHIVTLVAIAISVKVTAHFL